MNVSILIATYGDPEWEDLAWSRAHPSTDGQGASEVLVFHDPEGTIASVRNELGSQAKGDWFCFLDADDELAPGYLAAMEKLYESWRSMNGEPFSRKILFTPAVQYVRKGRPAPPQFNDRGIPLTEDNWLVVGTLIHRERFGEVGGFSDYPHGFEDWSLWAKCWKVGAEIVKVPDAVYVCHVNPQSKHKRGWRDRAWQVETHNRVRAELFG